jgi:hypothetical protein
MIDIFKVVIERAFRDTRTIKNHLDSDFIEAVLIQEVSGTLNQRGLGRVGRLRHGPSLAKFLDFHTSNPVARM